MGLIQNLQIGQVEYSGLVTSSCYSLQAITETCSTHFTCSLYTEDNCAPIRRKIHYTVTKFAQICTKCSDQKEYKFFCIKLLLTAS